MCGKMVTSCGMKRTSFCALHLRTRAKHINNTNAHTTIHNFCGIASVRSSTIILYYTILYWIILYYLILYYSILSCVVLSDIILYHLKSQYFLFLHRTSNFSTDQRLHCKQIHAFPFSNLIGGLQVLAS